MEKSVVANAAKKKEHPAAVRPKAAAQGVLL